MPLTPDFGYNSFSPGLDGPMSTEEGLLDEVAMGPTVGPPAQDLSAPPAPPSAPAEPAPIDPERIRERSTALWRAMDGWGTNEDAVMSSLRGMSPQEIAALRTEFQNHYGRDLDAMIRDEMGGDDLAEAEALLTADPVEGVLAGLTNSIGFWNDDEAKIEELMRGLSADDRARLSADPRWAAVRANVSAALGGSDLEVFEALESGDVASADAVRLDNAMGSTASWYNPSSWGTDEDAVYTELARLPAAERAAIEEQFNQRMAAAGEQTTLRDQLAGELSGSDHDRATAVLAGNTVDEQVARLRQTTEGLGTNESELFRLLEDTNLDAAARADIAARYEEMYGESLETAIADDTSGTDLERAQGAIAGNGQQDPAFMLFYSMEGMGTDEALIRSTLAGKSAEDIRAIRENWNSTYAERFGADFDAAFESELSGRDHFDIVEVALRGEPQNDQERAEILELQYSYERGDRATAFGRGYMDFLDDIGFSSSASQMDRQHERLQGMYDENGQVAGPEGSLSELYGWGQADLQDYRTAKDSATDALATGAEITVAALVTVATKGAASPWLVAVLSGVAGGAAGMAMREAVQGEAYGREAIGADVLKTALSAGISVGMQTSAISGRLEEIAGIFGDDMAREIAEAALKGGAGGALNGTVSGAMNEDAMRAGGGDYLLTILQSAGMGAFSGAVTKVASDRTGALLDGHLDRSTLSGEMLTEAVKKTSGAVASTAVRTGTYEGRAEDVIGRFLMAGGKAFVEGGVDGAVDYQTRTREVARLILSGRDPATIGDLKHLSEAQRQELAQRLSAGSGEQGPEAPEPAPKAVEAPAEAEVQRPVEAEVQRPAEAEVQRPADIDPAQSDDLRAYREQLVLNELVRLEGVGGNDDFVHSVLANSDDIDLMEQMLIRANGGSVSGGGSALGGVDATTPEGAVTVLVQGGIPRTQLDGLDPGSVDAMARYAQAYSAGDLEAANAAHAQLAAGLDPNLLTLVEGALVAHHYGLSGAQEVGLGPQARASQVLNEGFEASAEDLAGFQSYLGDNYDTYLSQLRSRVPPDHPAWSAMSEQELVAVYGYTTNDYRVLNPAMRGLDPASLAELMPYIAAAESGLQKLPSLGDMLPGGGVSIRGTGALPAEVDAQLQPGNMFSDRAFYSTSQKALDTFAGGFQFEIEGQSGRPVDFMSAFPEEMEILYPTGSRFQVLERTVDPVSGRTVIRLKETR